MSSRKTWVIFDEENSGPDRRHNTRTIEAWLRNNGDSQMAHSPGFNQLNNMIPINCSKYSAFDSLRRREEKGDYLGWSKNILGENQ